MDTLHFIHTCGVAYAYILRTGAHTPRNARKGRLIIKLDAG